MSSAGQPPGPDDLDEHLGDDELAGDEAAVARGLKTSALVVVFLGLVAAGLFVILGGEDEAPPVTDTEVGPIEQRQRTEQAPPLPFVDIAAAAGIGFTHTSGARGDKLLPETMGAGAAFLDLDGDGDADLLLADGRTWPEDERGAPRGGRPALYLNDGTGAFTEAGEAWGLAAGLYGTGLAVADYDGDGDRDVYLTAVGANRLLRNDGGSFTDVTAAAGVAGPDDAWSTSAGFFDADGDGDLDLFVCQYVRWSREIDFALDYQLVGVGRAYGPPTNYEGAHPILFRNDGDGTFTDVSDSAGIRRTNPATGVPVGKGLGLAFADLEPDGDIDVLVANDTVANFAFRNLGGGVFEEVGAQSGLAYDAGGNSTGAMGIDVGDYRNEGQLAIGIGNFANEMSSLYVAGGDSWQFADTARVEGVGAPSRAALSFGLLFTDVDLDGRLDLFQTNGHLEQEINQVQPSQHYRQPSQLFWNQGPEARATFIALDGDTLGDLALPIVGRGATAADIDADGDVDLLVTQVAGPPVLLRNDQATGHHWLRVKLVGRAPNTDALGARVELVAGGTTQRRFVSPTRSYLSQTEPVATFGLGDLDAVERLTVTWPDGTVTEVELPGVDRVVTVAQGD